MQRFFVPSEAVLEKTVRIFGADARHISFSLRMRRGDEISVCTPDGKQYSCRLDEFGDGYVSAKIESVSECRTEPPYQVRLYQALPKGDKFEVIVQKAVECGVFSIIPFESSRCIAKFGDSVCKKLERWNRIAAEAAKQCGRGRIPEVLPPLTYREMLAEASQAGLPLFCYEDECDRKLGTVLRENQSADISLVIGAEGGFSEEEAALAKESGMMLTGLGPRILRCETASGFALACISLCRELSF